METKGGPRDPIAITARDDVMTFRVNSELKSRFKDTCIMRGVSYCHVLEALMEAWIEGQAATATVIKPVVVNLTMQHVVKKPRRIQNFDDMMYEAQRKPWPPPCDRANTFIKSTREVGCLEIKDFIALEKCWRCFYTGGRAQVRKS